MGRGGKRSGSGRPPGAVNKVTAKTRQAAVESGQTPLDYMLSVMRDPSEFPERRDRMAIDGGVIEAAMMISQRNNRIVLSYYSILIRIGLYFDPGAVLK